ncbi:MAG: hypothetical protein ACHQ4J_09490 [Candidatus Binatia bacterium]
MRGHSVAFVAALAAVLGTAGLTRAQTIQPCGTPDSCAQVTLGSATAAVGGTATVGLTFKQGPDAKPGSGGIGEVAALALTISLAPITGGAPVGTPLGLADCTLDATGLPNAVVPDPSISNFNVVVENAICTPTRQHCLCPDAGSGITPDNFINLVIYGPNPLPTPGPNAISIPLLPAGPQQLLTINLKVNGDAASAIPLHIYNQGHDSSHPQFTAFLSVGDELAVDQTCTPLAVPGTPPCSAAASVSQVFIQDGTVTVPALCVGDCNGSGTVTVDEILAMVNIALGNTNISACLAGDADMSNSITIDEVLTAVNNALTGCH